MEDLQRRAKQPSNPLAGTYGHPVHPILVTIPIGAWFMSIVFDIASRAATTDAAMFYRGTLWLIGIGVIVALAAAIFGLMDLLQIGTRTRAFRTGLVHAGLNVSVVGVYVIEWGLRYAHRTYTQVPTGWLILNLIAFGCLVVSGAIGGMLAYRYGVRVADERTQAEGFEVPASGGVHVREPVA